MRENAPSFGVGSPAADRWRRTMLRCCSRRRWAQTGEHKRCALPRRAETRACATPRNRRGTVVVAHLLDALQRARAEPAELGRVDHLAATRRQSHGGYTAAAERERGRAIDLTPNTARTSCKRMPSETRRPPRHVEGTRVKSIPIKSNKANQFQIKSKPIKSKPGVGRVWRRKGEGQCV